jgi:hypothetical protein
MPIRNVTSRAISFYLYDGIFFFWIEPYYS